jgi:hypothetical protein
MAPAAFRLIVRTGPNPGMVFDLIKEATVLGRDVGNDVVLGDSEISRQHSRMTRTPGGYVLEDLGSTNGTFVNGERLAAPRVLNPGDIVGLGENVSLLFDSTAPEAAATMMGPAARGAAAPAARQAAPQRGAYPPPPAAPMPAMAQPAPQAPQAPAKRSSRVWLLAGCGCLVLVIVVALVVYLLPCQWYLPITSMFGYSYCP